MSDVNPVTFPLDRVTVPVIVRNNVPPFEQKSPVTNCSSFSLFEEDCWIVWGIVDVSECNEVLNDIQVFDLLHLRRSPGCWTRPMPGLGDPPFSFDTIISHLSSISVSHATTVEMRIVESIPQCVDSEPHMTVNEQLYMWATIFATLDLTTGVVEVFAVFIDGSEELFENFLQSSDRYVIIGSLVVVSGDDPVSASERRIFREIVEVIDGSTHLSAPISHTTREMNRPRSSTRGCALPGPSFHLSPGLWLPHFEGAAVAVAGGSQSHPGEAALLSKIGAADKGDWSHSLSDLSSLEYFRSTAVGPLVTFSEFRGYPTL